jgi:tetratricopeptide (TPR) repeat protein
VVTGTAGVGKTSVAVHWAHRVRECFPDGQLYLNLRGFDPTGTPVGAEEAVRSLLEALEVPAGRMPSGVDAQAGLYRSRLTGRRMLILLDNARTADQVRPLLPGAPGCLVLVTSRDQLTGLVATDHAQPVPLDLLDRAEARDLIRERLGAQRIGAEAVAVDAIIARCAGLPLALAVAAARAATRPATSLAAVAAELESAGGGLTPFADRDPAVDVRAVLSCSYRLLTEPGARLFRLLSIYPGPDLGVAAAISLAGGPSGEARAALAELAGACLLIETRPGRYAVHDLLRAYAAELAGAAERDEARHRILDHYLQTASAAALALEPHRDPVSMPPALAGVTPENPGAPRAWFDAEYATVVAAVHDAARAGCDTHAWGLAWSLTDVFNRTDRWHDQVACFTAAVMTAERDGDSSRVGYARRILARALARVGRQGDALDHLDRALEVFELLGDHAGQAHTHIMTSFVYESLNRPRNALRHDRRALELFRSAGHHVGEARALNNVGWRLITLGDHRQAIVHCEQAYALCQKLGNRYDEANVADSLGFAHFHLGRHREAIAFYRTALDLYRTVGHRVGEALCLMRLGDAHLHTEDPGPARPAWQQSLAILAEVGHPRADEVRTRLLDRSSDLPAIPSCRNRLGDRGDQRRPHPGQR